MGGGGQLETGVENETKNRRLNLSCRSADEVLFGLFQIKLRVGVVDLAAQILHGEVLQVGILQNLFNGVHQVLILSSITGKTR